MDFAARFPAVSWIPTCFCTTKRGRAHHAVDRLPFPADPTLTSIILDDGLEQFFKQTLLLPSLKPLMQHAAGNPKPFFFDGFPLAACPQNMPDAIHDIPIQHPWMTASRIFCRL